MKHCYILVFRLCHLLALKVCAVQACRWAIYASTSYDESADVLFASSHGLIQQSKEHVEPALPGLCEGLFYDPVLVHQRNHLVNQDGYGLGWFQQDEKGSMTPSRERSERGVCLPETNVTDPFLSEISTRTRSRILLAHVRAATDGDTNIHNSHPFQFAQLLWMHNGGVPDRRALLKLTDLRCVQLKDLATGSTDSEAVGAVFGTHLEGDSTESICARAGAFGRGELAEAMRRTIADLDGVASDSGFHASLNFAASDGNTVVVTRYRTAPKEDPPSLYFLFGEQWDSTTETMAGVIQVPFNQSDQPIRGKTLLVASEPLGRDYEGWRSLAKDQMLEFNAGSGELNLVCLSQACKEDIAYRVRVPSSNGFEDQCLA